MTDSKIRSVPFRVESISEWANERPEHKNWPVVYTINNKNEIYVGETTNAELRMRQHLASDAKRGLNLASFIVDDSFNKSVCLDLESHLIKYFHADGKYRLLNGNSGITDADYFNRDKYREAFQGIFDELVDSGTLTRSVPELINSDLFKYSPFKALTTDQALVIENILEKITGVTVEPNQTPLVVQGDPGTGKTIVAVYLMKLLQDIARSDGKDSLDEDSIFADFFKAGYKEQLGSLKIALVVPQLSLRDTIRKVFKRTPGLHPSMVLTPFDVGGNTEYYDLLVVDEGHRLQQRANQAAAMLNKKFAENNVKLFGGDDPSKTQLDWILAKSRKQILLLDQEQTVKPADLPRAKVEALVSQARKTGDYLTLTSQMRVTGGRDYVKFVGDLLSQRADQGAKNFGKYDLRFFESFRSFRATLMQRDKEVGLSRIVAGFAWPWLTKHGGDKDFEVDGVDLVWNRTDSDWVNSETSLYEVGSIHTIQGYDLNFCGVIIGPDLGFDKETGLITFNRDNYHDVKGKENNRKLGISYSDSDILEYVKNVYRVLLTRGILGTYVYVVDPDLREYLMKYF